MFGLRGACARGALTAAVVAATLFGSSLAGALLPTESSVGAAAPLVPVAAPSEPTDGLGAGGEVHLIDPKRILDTRPTGSINDDDRPGAKVLSALNAPGERFEVQILGRGGLPPVSAASQVLGVLANITIVEPTEAGYLSAWGSGRANVGESSIVNFNAGQTVPNMALVMPGDNGRLTIELVGYGVNTQGSAHVLIDVAGWISSSGYPSAGQRVIPAGPKLIYASRTNALGLPLGREQSVLLPVRGVEIDGAPVPSSASAALVNITAFNNLSGSEPTFLSVVPYDPAPLPLTSNLNLAVGEIKSNLALVPIPADGAVRVFNSRGNTHVEVSVVGYLESRPADTRAGRVVPLEVPFRIIDTRHSLGGNPVGRLDAGLAEDWDFRSAADNVRVNGVPVGPQSALLGNLTVAGIEKPDGWYGRIESYVSAYPTTDGAGSKPDTRNVNLADGAAVPNMALFRYGSGANEYRLRVYNETGRVDYIVDAAAVILAD